MGGVALAGATLYTLSSLVRPYLPLPSSHSLVLNCVALYQDTRGGVLGIQIAVVVQDSGKHCTYGCEYIVFYGQVLVCGVGVEVGLAYVLFDC